MMLIRERQRKRIKMLLQYSLPPMATFSRPRHRVGSDGTGGGRTRIALDEQREDDAGTAPSFTFTVGNWCASRVEHTGSLICLASVHRCGREDARKSRHSLTDDAVTVCINQCMGAPA
jgi:hypothetical protein